MDRECLLSRLFGILTCFVVSIVANEAIIGGTKAKFYQFPYQVSISFDRKGHDCGGAIIGNLHILTAAHCLIKHDNSIETRRLYVFAGSNDLRTTGVTVSKAQVKKIYVPLAYNPTDPNRFADIAVLKLKAPMLSPYLQSLDLPMNKSQTYVDETAVISGWGWNEVVIRNNQEKGKHSDDILRFVDVVVLKHNRRGCPQQMDPNKQICARVKNLDGAARGTCPDDNGGPLVVDGKIVIGILTRSPFACSEKDSSSIYTRVSHYIDFVVNALNDRQTKDMRTLERV